MKSCMRIHPRGPESTQHGEVQLSFCSSGSSRLTVPCVQSKSIQNPEGVKEKMVRISLFKRLVGIAAVLLLGVFINSSAHAQYETASVLGFVHDASGAGIQRNLD
jgi:hypothetical protein